MVRGVIFDLWQTLARWPEQKSAELRRAWSQSLDVPSDRLHALWTEADFYRLRETGPIATAIEALAELLDVEVELEEVVAQRVELTREALVPVEGAVQTLRELRRRGVATGLVSNCTEEVALVWEDTAFAGLFDVAVFSATVGFLKPDPRIYRLALDGLGLDGRECLFVGDGANDELEGARRLGMTPVLVHPDGDPPPWDGLAAWSGLRVSTIPQVLDLVS